jgi:PAT family beta-lactamase induction signal transducer AmpG
VIGGIGRRKSWIMLCQAVMICALIGLVLTDPTVHIARFALFAFIGAIGSATQDIAVDGWRIDIADEQSPVELLSAIYQLGYRTASIVGGAGALYMAARMSWPTVYLVMAVLRGVMLAITLTAPDTERPPRAVVEVLAEAGEINPRIRVAALAIVGAAWAWAIVTIVMFMVGMLAERPPGVKPPSVGDFLKFYGPVIVFATVVVPLGIAAGINWLKARGREVQQAVDPTRSSARTAANHLYGALVAPLVDLTARLRWGVLIVIGLILTYALCYNIWASFAYPFYLDFMHYSKDEVAFASKIFGIVMSIIGVSIGGYLFLRIGRFPTVLIGAAAPIFGNFLYADLADGAPHIDMVLHLFRLDLLAQHMGSDDHMARLLLTICYENISTGLAGAAFVAFVSGIVSKKFAAVQYALLSSLTFLIGSLGKGVAGEMIDKYGYATVFREVAVVGLLAILFVLLEWWRSSAVARRAEPGDTGQTA